MQLGVYVVYRYPLVCVDFRSVEAQRLLARAASLGGGDDGRLAVVTVIEVGTFEDDQDAVASLVEEEYNARSAHLERLCSDAGHPGAERRVLVGKAAAEIADCARQLGCDLVVLGEHEQDRRPPGLGSTADALLKRLSCDALVVRTSG